MDLPQTKIKLFAEALETTQAELMGWDDKTVYDTGFPSPIKLRDKNFRIPSYRFLMSLTDSEREVLLSVCSRNEIELILKYRLLDDYGKKNVNMVLENELDRGHKQNVIAPLDNEPYVPEVLAASRPNEEMEDMDRADLDDVLKLVEKEKRKQKTKTVKKYDEPER